MGTVLSALGLVFLAELGDKTQLVAMGLGARHRLGPVLLGVGLGYAATGAVSVAVGAAFGAALPTRALGIGGGLLFLVFAGWNLRSPGEEELSAVGPAAAAGSTARIVASVAGAMFVAELGDKTMLATATLAAQGDPALVWIGATVGITLSGLVGVLVGRLLGARLPERATRFGSAALFAAFGAFLLATSL